MLPNTVDFPTAVGRRASHRRGGRAFETAFWCAVAIVSSLGIFVLPFVWPPRVATFSGSYEYGFNNRVAELFAVAASAAVTLILWQRGLGRTPKEALPSERMPRRWLLYGSLVATLFTAVLGTAVLRSHVSYSDAGYFMLQIDRVVHDHAVLYREVQFPYGPILLYWPAAVQEILAPIGISSGVAYLITLASMQIIGLAILFYILEWLPLSYRTRQLMFWLCTFATLTPLLGVNYTLLRFLLPHSLFLAITRQRSLAMQSILLGLGQLVAIGFSPEIALAFLGGVGCYALYRCFTDRRVWIVAAVLPCAAFILITVISRRYFSVMGTFAAGAYNILVAPDFHILVLLIAAIGLSPMAVAGYLRTPDDSRAAPMLGFYIISLGMLGPALGRCDSLHTFFGGLGVYLLSLVATEGALFAPARKWAKAWVLALSLAIVCSQVEDFYFYRESLIWVFFKGPSHKDSVDVDRLEALTHGLRIAAPVNIPLSVRQELMRRDQFQPNYFMDAWDDKDERAKIEQLRKAPLALVPTGNYLLTHDEMDQSRRLPLLHTHIRYRRRFSPWVSGALLKQEIHDNWTPIGTIGPYTVYRQNGR